MAEDVLSGDILDFLLSLRDSLKVDHVFDVTDKPESSYRVKAFVCFVGAHYFIFVRNMKPQSKDIYPEDGSRSEWTLFNDASIRHFRTWSSVVEYCVDTKTVPTIVFMEEQGNAVDDFRISYNRLEMLKLRAKDHDSIILDMKDQYLVREQERLFRTLSKGPPVNFEERPAD